MATVTPKGGPQFPSIAGSIQPSTQSEMDAAIEDLQKQKHAWVALSLRDRIALIDRLIQDVAANAQRWVAACNQAKGLDEHSAFAGEEWSMGPLPMLKVLRQTRQSLIDIEAQGYPRIPGAITTRSNGQVVAQVLPQSTYDRLFFSGVTAEIWMEPGVTERELPLTQAVIYQDKQHPGKVALVLGAGNVSSIGPLDILYKLFTEDQVVLLKMNPVNAYIGPLLVESFRALIEAGYLRITYGGAEEGKYLCNHAGIEEIHITGSDKTFEAIVFGTGPEGAERKANNQPLLTKRITGELGNVSPVIVVPGPWKTRELDYQAEHLATMLTTNAGFNCNATRVIIQQAEWEESKLLMQKVRKVLAQVPTRNAYYPGAHDRQRAFVKEHPEAEEFGKGSDEQLPWTLIAGLDPSKEDDICFTTEAFCGLFSETEIEAANVVEYIERAVDFANERLWGTLNATILVHPESLKNPEIAQALDRASERLRYGTIGINYWAAASFAIGITTWGGFPGASADNIQSGIGVVHNTLMFEKPQKSVIRAPFMSIPTPPWFATRGKIAAKVFPKLVEMEANPSPWKVPGILQAALGG